VVENIQKGVEEIETPADDSHDNDEELEEEAEPTNKRKSNNVENTNAKKPKPPASRGESNTNTGITRNENGEPFIVLGDELLRVTCKKFKGRSLIDIRKYYRDEDKLKPGRQGISMSPKNWEFLKENFQLIDEAISLV